MRAAGLAPPIPVICVGNMTIGGSGKTPAAVAIAGLLRDANLHAAFLTRGYGGRLTGPLAVDASRHTAAEVGDEPLLLARHARTIVSRDRPAGMRLAVELGARAIVMDDGLQNPSLRKSATFAVFDGAVGIGNGRVLPAGPLRARPAAQWPLVDAAILIGDGAQGDILAEEAGRRGRPAFRARLAPDPDAARSLAGRRVLAFAGIGRPDKFLATLAECGAEIVRRKSFADHHRYRPAELRDLVRESRRDDLTLVTTEKDAARLGGAIGAEPGSPELLTLPVELRFDDPTGISAFLREALARFR